MRILREHFDPSAALGVPAHITLLHPFVAPPIDAAVFTRLREVAAARPGFRFRLRGVRSFATAIWLAPAPAAPFVELTHRLAAAFPGFAPYGRAHDDVVPHLTVAYLPAADDVQGALRVRLPAHGIACACHELALIENASGRWRERALFRLTRARGTAAP